MGGRVSSVCVVLRRWMGVLILTHCGGFHYYYCPFVYVIHAITGYQTSVGSPTWQHLAEEDILCRLLH